MDFTIGFYCVSQIHRKQYSDTVTQKQLEQQEDKFISQRYRRDYEKVFFSYSIADGIFFKRY